MRGGAVQKTDDRNLDLSFFLGPRGMRAPSILLFISSWLAIASASALTALPSGTWLATPNLPVNFGVPNGVLTVRNVTLVVSADTGDFKFYGTFLDSRGSTVQASFAGAAACTEGDRDRLLFSVTASSCSSPNPVIAWFCQLAPAAFSGSVNFGISDVLLIDKWGGTQWPFVFACAHEPCVYQSACNSTVTINTIIQASDSTLVVNGTQNVIFEAGSSTNNNVTIEGDTVTVVNSQVTLQQSTEVTESTININGGTTNEFTFETPTSTEYNFYTTAPASCRNFASLSGSRASNVTISTASYTRIEFTSSELVAPGSDWALSPDESTLEFQGTDGGAYAYSLEACLQLGLLYNPTSVGVGLVVSIYNRTASAVAIGSPVLSAVIYNHTNPALITGVCTTTLISGVYTGNRFAIYATLETTDLSAHTSPISVSSWSLIATPLACQGNTINVRINASFNDTQLEAGECIDIDYPTAKRIRISNPGMCGPEDTDTVTWEETNSGFWAATCTAVKSNGTTSACSPLCSASSSSSYITVTIDANRTATIDFGGVGALIDSSTLVWENVAPNQWRGTVQFPTGQNYSRCGMECDEATQTINVEKLCAEEQCKVQSDPPVTEPGTPLVFLPCMLCGTGDNGGSDGDGDGGNSDGSDSSFPIVPLIPPFLPPIIPFFPPIVPVVAGGGGGSGGGSAGVPPPPGSPTAPVPIVITVPVGAPEPTTEGGTYLPGTNFTQAPVYCGPSTHKLAVVDQSTLPEIFYICMITANGTYAWVPHPATSAAASNTTVWYYTTTLLLQDQTTLFVSNTSQAIFEGSTYQANAYIRNLYVNGSASFCEAELRSNTLSSCSGTLTLNGTQVIVTADSLTAPVLSAPQGRFGEIISDDMIGSPVRFPNGIDVEGDSSFDAPVEFTAAAPITADTLTVTTFNIVGLTAPFYHTSSVSGLYYVPIITAGTLCTSYTPMSTSFGLTFVRVGATKFVYWDWTAPLYLPSALVFDAANGCAAVTLSTTANTLTRYDLPSPYRPTTAYSTAVTSISAGAVRSTPFATYLNSLGFFAVQSDNGGADSFPTGQVGFFMPTLMFT
jgi:hypothetical protein